RAGRPKRWYFDAASGLLLRTEVRDANGALVKREDYDDFRAVDGVKIPFTIRGIDEDGIEFVVMLDEVKQNVPIDPSRFEKPQKPSVALPRETRPKVPGL